MKKVFSTAMFFMASFFLNQLLAQISEDDIQIIQGAWGKQKRELVSVQWHYQKLTRQNSGRNMTNMKTEERRSAQNELRSLMIM